MKQKNEKERFIRETVIKYFFDMSKSTYTIMVLGGLAALFKKYRQTKLARYRLYTWGLS